MSASTTFSPLLQIPIKKLPPRVITEVFPIFENVLTPETHVAIGVSSGVDSMSVACLLIIRYAHKNFPLSHLHIIHCNHKLRKQSEVEEQFMQDFFKGIPLHVYHRPPTL
ncbi:MAG: hypothetical protein LBO09_02440 [Candidatus Peribacteria bacterium]|nr:hypothetical protein [Candidatus Peribacteria bacterium]